PRRRWRCSSGPLQASPRRSGPARSRRRRTLCSRGGLPGSAELHWSSTCRARRAAAETASRSCGPHCITRSSCCQASAIRPTGRRDHGRRVIAIEVPRRFASLVKIEHTVFALPFAYVGAFLAVGDVPRTHDLVWITVAMVGARSLAMALNRLIDAQIDARNPRTAGRELPAGRLTAVQVIAFCAGSLALFLIAVWQL